MSPKIDPTTRDKLFMAGISVFAQKGYRDATVREICKKAGSSNINAVNYYFTSKEGLYRQILELIFKEYDVRIAPNVKDLKPEDRLRSFISTNCELLYHGGTVGSDLTTIFVTEMARPSPFLVEMVDKYNRPRIKIHLDVIRDIIGHDKPEETVRNCLVSVSGQILYYSFAWPVFSRLFPDDDQKPEHEKLAAHIFKFSMGGLMAVKGCGTNKTGEVK